MYAFKASIAIALFGLAPIYTLAQPALVITTDVTPQRH